MQSFSQNGDEAQCQSEVPYGSVLSMISLHASEARRVIAAGKAMGLLG